MCLSNGGLFANALVVETMKLSGRSARTIEFLLLALLIQPLQLLSGAFAGAQADPAIVSQVLSQGHRPPIIIAVDGWRSGETGYLGEALAKSQNIMRMMGAEKLEDMDIKAFGWTGTLSDTSDTVKDLMRNITDAMEVARNDQRPLVIVSHSWGGVLSLLALHELEKKGELKPDEVDLLMTIHSPLNLPIPNPHLPLAKLQRPSSVRAWSNYYSIRDPLSPSPVPQATSNEDTGQDHKGSYTDLTRLETYGAVIASAVQKFSFRKSEGREVAERADTGGQDIQQKERTQEAGRKGQEVTQESENRAGKGIQQVWDSAQKEIQEVWAKAQERIQRAWGNAQEKTQEIWRKTDHDAQKLQRKGLQVSPDLWRKARQQIQELQKQAQGEVYQINRDAGRQVQEINDEAERQVHRINTQAQQQLEEINQKAQQRVAEIDRKAQEQVQTLNKEAQREVQFINTQAQQQVQKTKGEGQQQVWRKAQQEIQQVWASAQKRIQEVWQSAQTKTNEVWAKAQREIQEVWEKAQNDGSKQMKGNAQTRKGESLSQLVLGKEYQISQRYLADCSDLGPEKCPYQGGKHPGIDIGAPRGQPVVSATSGKVISILKSIGGVAVYDGRNTVIYLHMSEINEGLKDKDISKGSHLGKVGSVGLATGPHLHIEVRKGKHEFAVGKVSGDPASITIDPASYLLRAGTSTLQQ